MSIHRNRAFHVARKKGAAAGQNYAVWDEMSSWSKRELIEIVLHLAACRTGEYDDAINDGRAYLEAKEERQALQANGLI